MRGTVYFMRGNVRFQITTEERVYFYLISRETLEPQLENVMGNYLGCSNLLFGARVRYGVAFKASEPGIQVHRRRLFHNFKVCLHQEPSGEAVCDELRSLKQFIVGRQRRVQINWSANFQMAVEWEIKTAPDLEILYLKASSDERKIGVFVGRRQVKNQVEICELMVFKRNQQNNWQLDARVDHAFSRTTCA